MEFVSLPSSDFVLVNDIIIIACYWIIRCVSCVSVCLGILYFDYIVLCIICHIYTYIYTLYIVL